MTDIVSTKDANNLATAIQLNEQSLVEVLFSVAVSSVPFGRGGGDGAARFGVEEVHI